MSKSSTVAVFLFLLLSAPGLVGLAQTTGFITTRPTCVPPNGAQDTLNYIQGPDPILLDNNDIAILVDTGHCCTGHWEGIFSLIYPAAGHAATPRFSGIWATNNFDTEPARGEDEAPFPSAIFFNGKWRIAYTSTFLPHSMTDRDRVARLDLDNLTYRAQSSQVTNQWVKPIDPNCRTLGSCSGKGSGVLGTFVLHPNGDLYVYHPDGNYPSCVSGWVRHKIGSNMSVVNPAGDGCISLTGLTAAPTWVSDIARGADGKLYMLTTRPNNITNIDEWVSTGSDATIGLTWNKTGRTWVAPTHPNPPNVYSVWDAGYLKNSNRQIVEPKVVVAQISEGSTWTEITDVTLGKWYLYYWADAGANLPPSFGGTASSCAFGGNHDAASCQSIAGWAWDPVFPNSPISVDIFDGATLIATAPANIYRGDLVAAGKGNGVHGFSWTVPVSLKNGAAHSITVKYSGTQTKLPNSPKSITCAPPPVTYNLVIGRAGTGSGTVTSSPSGINCGADCSESYNSGTVVTLTATAASGSTFAGWSGDADCSDGVVTMSAAHSCTATFNSIVTARTIWIQPQPLAGFGPPGSLVLAGSASGAPAGTGVVMTWRDFTAGGSWVTEPFAPAPDSSGIWYNSIANANYYHQYQVYLTYGGYTSGICTYQGTNAITWCP